MTVVELHRATSPVHLATETPPFALDEARAARLRPVLQTVLTRLEAVARSLAHPLAHPLKDRSA